MTAAALPRQNTPTPQSASAVRVAMLAQTAYPQDIRVRRAARALRAAGYSVDVVCIREPRTAPAVESIDGVRVIRLPISRHRGSRLRYLAEYASFFVLATAILAIRHAATRYALIHVHTLPDFLVFAGWLPQRFGARVLLDMHDPVPELLASKYRLHARHPLVRLASWVEQASARAADRVVTVHEPLRQVFIGRGALPEKVGVVMNLVDRTEFPRRERMPVERGEFVLMYAGLIAARYGVDLAVRALAHHLRDRIRGVRLRIVGNGDQVPELRRLVDELEVRELVEFVPQVAHADVWRLLQDADVGLSPHRATAPFSLSNKVYEYVAVGVPAVVARTACIQQYYPEDVVRFFEPGDVQDLARAILELYYSPDERRARVAAGWRLTDGWNWQQEQDRLIGIVDELVSRSAAT